MIEKRERLLQWLRDAHAMEEQAETMLNALSARIERYPELRDQIEYHLSETRTQAHRLRKCMNALDTAPSGIKDMAGRMVALGQGIAGLFVGDEVVKGAMAAYTFEHFEIAAYKALIAAADACGEISVADVGRQNLREEEAMAGRLAAHLPEVTKAYLEREAVGAEAKR